MTVKDLTEKYSLEVLCHGELAPEREITGGYCGDLLSWVMSRAQSGDCWLTVMGNVNSIGVAVLAAFDGDALKRAEENDVIVLRSEKNSFELAAGIKNLL